MTKTIGFIPGTDRGLATGRVVFDVLNSLGCDLEITEYDIGARRYVATGELIPVEILNDLRRMDAIFVGAPPVGGPEIPVGILEHGIVFALRAELDLAVNVRTSVGIGPLGPIDVTVVRENTEGGYRNEGGTLREGTPHEVATQGSVNTWYGVDRCVRYAFELGRRERKRVTLVHKAVVLRYSGKLWRRVFESVASEYPDVETGYENVDTACIHLVQDPSRYSIVVTDNLFGDILSDLACAIAGGTEISGSAELNIENTGPSLFEPVHGTHAYDQSLGIRSNPLAGIAAAALMIDHLGCRDAAQRLFSAIRLGSERTNTEGEAFEAFLSSLKDGSADV